MKYLKLFEELNEEPQGEEVGMRIKGKGPDPWNDLKGDDLKVFEAADALLSEFDKEEWFEKSCYRQKMEPIITCIIDQKRSLQGGKRDSKDLSKDFYIFVNNWVGKGYIEIEANISSDYGSSKFHATGVDQSSHGYPASYGYTVYEYNRKTGEITYDKEFFKVFLRK